MTSINLALDLGLVPVPLIGKRVAVTGWQNIAEETTCETLKVNENCDNIGVVCGKKSGIVVVVIKKKGIKFWDELCNSNTYPKTFIVETGADGYHYYFKYDERIKHISHVPLSVKEKGITVKTDNDQVMFVGSIDHKTMKPYTILYQPDETIFYPIPDWLLNVLIETSM